MKPIGTIEEELADCLSEIAKHPNAKWFWCLHHEKLFEELSEPVKNRIAYIQKEKPEAEQAVRFRNLRPVKDPKALAAAWAEYEKVRAAAWAEYQKVRAAAWAEYQKVRAAAWAEYEKVRAPAWAEYEKVRAPAWAEYEKVTAAALAEYEKVTAAAWAEYEKVRAAAWAVIADQLNSEWPENTWQGKSIFEARGK